MGFSRRAFTLIELLVVIGVITILIGILVPVGAKARKASARVACRGHLSDIGRAFQMYLNDSKGKLPQYLNPIPSQDPPTLPGKPAPEIFDPYTKGVRTGWRCNSDRITRRMDSTPEGYETYFEREGLSYFYNVQLRATYAGMRLNDTNLYKIKQQNRLVIFNEFEPFHGPENTNGSMNYLFADMHVGDLANE
jgi:prepilin-type N-terminal cleavage/methylation domain-containing protein